MIRMVGGAILLSKQDKNGEQKWVTGVTSDGISASLVTAGVINAGEIEIMDYDQPLFRWNSHGISAFGADARSTNGLDYVTNFNSKKFVRFDKNGIYGISEEADIDGLGDWYPGKDTEDTAEADINKKATFALTWDGLKVTNSNDVTLHIGDSAKTESGSKNLMRVTRGEGESEEEVFCVTENGSFLWSTDSLPTKTLYARTDLGKPTGKYNDYKNSNDTDASGKPITDVWHKIQSEDDWFASYSYDGGNTWSDPT
jgi:hypothetical protein